MKINLYLTAALMLIGAFGAVAQPTITASTIGEVGDSFSYDFVNATGFDPGPSGAAVTWDFSDISLAGTSYGYTFVTVGSTGFADDFPGANLATDQGDGVYTYYKGSPSEFSLYGVHTDATTLSYSDPETLYSYPMTFGTTFSDNLYCSFFSGVDVVRSGSISVEADGYGTLILPSGTYDNVLRVVAHEVYSDEFIGLPTPTDYDFTNYYFMREGTIGALFQYSYLEIGGLFPTTQESAAVNTNIGPMSINEENTNASIGVYPNPAQQDVTINLQHINAEQVIITDMAGRQVLTTTPGFDNFVRVNVEALPEGIYFARVLANNKTYSNQFQIIR